jgi:hypothetical protein
MDAKKMFTVKSCLALLLAIGELAGVTFATAGTTRFDSASSSSAVSAQRRGTRRKVKRRMIKRAEEGRLAEGPWGGDHVRLRVREGGAEVEFDCAHGTLAETLALDAEGRFDVSGTYVREGPGPIRLNRLPSARPARYSGRVEGQTMTLSVKFNDNSQALDALTLARGSEGRLWKCR